MAEKKAVGYRDITLSNVDSPESQIWLGLMAADQLNIMGSVTFFVGDDGGVRVANPIHVYIDGPGSFPDNSSHFRWVRPIVGELKPQFCAWKDNQLWEIEFVEGPEDLPAEAPGSEGH